MACGLPVVATDVGGTGELVRGGEQGCLIRAGDSAALVERSARILTDPAVAARMRTAARARAEAFGLAVMVRGDGGGLCARARAAGGMSELPFVSVVIPMRNEADSIGSLLDSVLAQDYPAERFEVLVVDGDSDDDSAAVGRDRMRRAIRACACCTTRSASCRRRSTWPSAPRAAR